MNTSRWCLLDHVTLATGDAMDVNTAFDLHGARTLDVLATVHTAGTGIAPKLLLRHAMAHGDKDGYLDFATPIAVDLTVAASTWSHVEAFTGYLAWFLDGTLDEGAEVSVHLIARS